MKLHLLKIVWTLLLFVSAVAAQEAKTTPMLLCDFDEIAEPNVSFGTKLRSILKKQADLPKDSLLFLAISTGPLRDNLEMRKQARGVFKELGFLENQFTISHPFNSYKPTIRRTQLWLVSQKTHPPYTISKIQDSCIGGEYSNIQIVGKSFVDRRTERLFFEAKNLGPWPQEFIEFGWSAKNGRIEDGQGARKVTVSPTSKEQLDIEVQLEVVYIDNPCAPIAQIARFVTSFE